MSQSTSNRKPSLWIGCLAAGLALPLAISAGCEKEGPMERAGERADEKMERIGEEIEEVGEEIEDAAEDVRENPPPPPPPPVSP